MDHNMEIEMGSNIQVWYFGGRGVSMWDHGILVSKAMPQIYLASKGH